MEPIECLDSYLDSPCRGEVEYRYPLSGTGRSFARCDAHWEFRLEREDEIRRRYPSRAPADFDPYYAGEEW